MASAQLLTKQVIIEELTGTIQNTEVRFNLSRGQVARVLGFNISHVNTQKDQSFAMLVKKSVNSPAALRPSDILFAYNVIAWEEAAGNSIYLASPIFNLPKPYRTTGISVQASASKSTTIDMILVIYYDVDKMIEGEATQALEKSKQRGISRRNREFD